MNNTGLNWENLKNWLNTRSLKLDLSFKPERFKKGIGNLNYKILLNEKFAVIRRPPLGPLPPGANDMKSSIASWVVAASKFISKNKKINGSLSLFITGDEEGVAINGTK